MTEGDGWYENDDAAGEDYTFVASDALVMLRSRTLRPKHAAATGSTSTTPMTTASSPSTWFIVPRYTPIYFKLLNKGVSASELKLPPASKTIQDCFDSARRGTALCLLRRSDFVRGSGKEPKPSRLVQRVDQGGAISRSDVMTICGRAEAKGYAAVDCTAQFCERDWEACSL